MDFTRADKRQDTQTGMSIRLSQIDIFLPFYKTRPEIKVFYRYTLMDDGMETVEVPLLRRSFEARSCQARFDAHRAIGDGLAAALGLPFVWENAAMSAGWIGETRTHEGFA